MCKVMEDMKDESAERRSVEIAKNLLKDTKILRKGLTVMQKSDILNRIESNRIESNRIESNGITAPSHALLGI